MDGLPIHTQMAHFLPWAEFEYRSLDFERDFYLTYFENDFVTMQNNEKGSF